MSNKQTDLVESSDALRHFFVAVVIDRFDSVDFLSERANVLGVGEEMKEDPGESLSSSVALYNLVSRSRGKFESSDAHQR